MDRVRQTGKREWQYSGAPKRHRTGATTGDSSSKKATLPHIDSALVVLNRQMGDHFRTINWIPRIENRDHAAIMMYLASRRTQLPVVVLGLRDLRRIKDPHSRAMMSNFGTLASAPGLIAENLTDHVKYAMHKDPAGFRARLAILGTRGAILREAPNAWWPGLNDLVILGSIHAGKDFAIGIATQQFEPQRHLWETRYNRPTTLGRELLVIYGAGYRRVFVPGQDDSYAFAVTQAEANTNLSTLTLRDFTRWAAEVKTMWDMANVWHALTNTWVESKTGTVEAPRQRYLSNIGGGQSISNGGQVEAAPY